MALLITLRNGSRTLRTALFRCARESSPLWPRGGSAAPESTRAHQADTTAGGQSSWAAADTRLQACDSHAGWRDPARSCANPAARGRDHGTDDAFGCRGKSRIIADRFWHRLSRRWPAGYSDAISTRLSGSAGVYARYVYTGPDSGARTS